MVGCGDPAAHDPAAAPEARCGAPSLRGARATQLWATPITPDKLPWHVHFRYLEGYMVVGGHEGTTEDMVLN